MTDVVATSEHLRRSLPRTSRQSSRAELLPRDHVRRTLETGMFVIYARPFTRSRGLPKLEPALAGLPEDVCLSHHEIIERRHRVYAHTDDTAYRRVDQIDAWLQHGADAQLLQSWDSPLDVLLEHVLILAHAHRAQFYREALALRSHLRPEVTPPPDATS